MNILGLTIGKTPPPPAPPARKKQKRSFAGASFSRLNFDWLTSGSSQDAEVQQSHGTLRNRGRSLGRDNPNSRAFLSGLETNVIGLGFRMQSIIKDGSGKSNSALNSLVEAEWKKWCRPDSCDVRGMLSFQDIERLMIRSVAEGGEPPLIRLIPTRSGKSKVPLSLQVIESDHLDENFNVPPSNGKNEIRMGVEITTLGRPVAYHIFDRHPGDNLNFAIGANPKRIRVPAAEIIHFFRHERPGQTRGYSWLASVSNVVRQLGAFIESSAIRKRIEAAIMYFIQRTQGDDLPDDDEDEVTGQRIKEVAPGKIEYLEEGETVISPPITSNPAADAQFVETQLQQFAAGTNSSTEMISRDFTKSNYSSSRLSLGVARDNYMVLQQWMEGNFHQKLFEEFMFRGYLADVFNFPNFLKNEELYNQAKWLPRRWPSVDPYKDVLANVIKIDNMFATHSEILSEDGKDFEETVLQVKKEREFMKLHGVTTKSLIEQKVIEDKNTDKGEEE